MIKIVQSITERLTNKPDAVQQASTNKSDYISILTSVRATIACNVLSNCHVSRDVFNTYSAQSQTLTRTLLARGTISCKT